MKYAGYAYTEEGFASPLWRNRVALGPDPRMTRRKWVRWRRFLNHWRRRYRNEGSRGEAWAMFSGRTSTTENSL